MQAPNPYLLTRIGEAIIYACEKMEFESLSDKPEDMLDDLASLFGGTVVDGESFGETKEVMNLMYRPMEAIFGAVAEKMVGAGWSIYPQGLTDRRPGKVDGEAIKWKEQHNLAFRRPEPQHLARWIVQCPTLNVAVVLGPASGNALVIDIDVVEKDLSSMIQQLAFKHFGETPLQRVGRAPKIALVYRQSPDDPIGGRSPRFVPIDHPQNPNGDDQMVEILSSGQSLTFYGKHHKTGNYFKWLKETPDAVGPEACPIISSQQMGDFLDEVDSIRQFARANAFEGAGVTYEWDENQEIHVPIIRQSGAAINWSEDDNGLVSDGREAYLRDMVFRVVTANPGVATGANNEVEAGVLKLSDIVVQQFSATAVTSGKWSGQSLRRAVVERVRRVAAKIRSGEIKPVVPRRNEEGKYIQSANARTFLPQQPRDAEGDSLDFLPPFVDPTRASFDPSARGQRRPLRIEIVEADTATVDARRAEREIESDRTRIGDAVSQGLLQAFHSFWDYEVYDPQRESTRVTILKAPTGAGKTSRGMRFISEDPRTKEDYVIKGPGGEIVSEGRNPILVLMPTYTNIEELKEKAEVYNLDPSLTDAELRRQAADAGLMHEDDLPEKLAEIRRDAKNAGVSTMLYQGKLRAGCLMKDKVEMAMAAGVGTSGLCHIEEKKDKQGKVVQEERYCPFYHQHHKKKHQATGEETEEWAGCPAIEQKENIQKNHVVFLPHAFLALSIPEELKHVRAVVADERIHHLFLHTDTFEMDIFETPRKAPRLNKKEKEDGADPSEFAAERTKAVDVVSLALHRQLDPARELLKKEGVDPETKQPIAMRWVKSALRTCGASMERDANITPDISLEDLMDICAQPTGKAVRQEWRFWKIIEERMTLIHEENALQEMRKETGLPPLPSKVSGDHDYRIQVVEDMTEKGPKKLIRISWRTEPNWVDRPLLLLDASAAPDMISKIWKGKEVIVRDIPAALNVRIVSVVDRTYSNASVVAKPSATAKEKIDSARLLSQVRSAISTVSGYYGWSRVVAGGSILARRAVNTQWEGPANVDWCHFGAMRGLDFAKWHAAAISVGRMELPIRTIDGLVAALTYDDPHPEEPYDSKGTGLNALGQPLMVPTGVQRVRMRSGHDLDMPVPMYPGMWGRMIQKQYREEELLQFLGRVRPVFREGIAPIWFSLSSVIPEEVIVDDLITIEDLLRRGHVETSTFEAMRRCHGVIDPDVAAELCDDLFPSAFHANRQMKLDGFDAQTGTIDRRSAWGVVTLKWRDIEMEEGFSFVRACVYDPRDTERTISPEEALRNAFKAAGLPSLESIEKVSETRPQTLARGRKLDKIEADLGTLVTRRKEERRHRIDVAVDVLMNTPAEAIEALREERKSKMLPVLIPSGVRRNDKDQTSEEYRTNFAEIESRVAIETLWRKMGYGEEKISAMLAGIGMGADATGAGEDYSDGGAHVADAAYDEFDSVIEW
jgi:hypothetical protein